MTTLCGVGYGDISPRNDVERGFVIVVIVLGSLAHTLVFANIAAQVEGFGRIRFVNRLRQSSTLRHMLI